MTKWVTILFAFVLGGCLSQTDKREAMPDQSSGIIQGQIVTRADPLGAHVVLIHDLKLGYVCTGTIIAKDLVVTGAHCLSRKHNQYEIIFGLDGFALLDDKKSYAEFYRTARHVVIHESYGGGPDGIPPMNQSDIALIYFNGGLPQGFNPVAVKMDETSIKKGREVTVAGYGLSEISGAEIKYKKSAAFKKAVARGEILCDHRVLDQKGLPTCLEISGKGDGRLRMTHAPIKFIFESEFILDEKKTGTCQGDSGGPAFVEEEGILYLVGITSRGDLLCDGEGVYTSIGAFTDWLLTH